MTKQHLRKEYLSKRAAIPEAERVQLTEKLTDQFANIHFSDTAFTLSYIGIPNKAEIIPTAIESALLNQQPDCTICYPKTDLSMHSMQAIAHHKGIMLQKNKWGIDEPESGTAIDPQQIDVILVPLLSFDKRGYRVGYGKGFYDRFIVRCRPDVITIGLSFFEPVESIDDIDEYDMPMKYCVTPQQVFQF